MNNIICSYYLKDEIKRNNKAIVYTCYKYNKKYIAKIEDGLINPNDINEKKILEILNRRVNVPKIIYMTDLKYNKKIKIYSFIDGTNKYNDITDKEIKSCTLEVKKINDIMLKQSKNINCEIGDINKKLDDFRKITKDRYYLEIIDYLKSNSYFQKKIKEDPKIIIHDDLHRGNILFNNNRSGIIDFIGLKKYPKSMQLASYVALFCLTEREEIDINLILNIWNDSIDLLYLKQLILFRLLKAYMFFYNIDENDDNYWRKELLDIRIREWRENI